VALSDLHFLGPDPGKHSRLRTAKQDQNSAAVPSCCCPGVALTPPAKRNDCLIQQQQHHADVAYVDGWLAWGQPAVMTVDSDWQLFGMLVHMRLQNAALPLYRIAYVLECCLRSRRACRLVLLGHNQQCACGAAAWLSRVSEIYLSALCELQMISLVFAEVKDSRRD